MTRLTFCALVLGLFVIVTVADSLPKVNSSEGNGILECLYETNSLACAKKHADAELDAIETRVAGRGNSITLSQVLEEAGTIVVDGTRTLFDDEMDDFDDSDEVNDNKSSKVYQSRKKFGKKKKKMLQKLVAFGMIIKSKISLLLQLISTHFQFKFFVIAVISLMINIARFWIDVKKDHHPAKVVYYEHAQHQHHYDHEDHHVDHDGYWGRSDEEAPAQELAYSAYHKNK